MSVGGVPRSSPPIRAWPWPPCFISSLSSHAGPVCRPRHARAPASRQPPGFAGRQRSCGALVTSLVPGRESLPLPDVRGRRGRTATPGDRRLLREIREFLSGGCVPIAQWPRALEENGGDGMRNTRARAARGVGARPGARSGPPRPACPPARMPRHTPAQGGKEPWTEELSGAGTERLRVHGGRGLYPGVLSLSSRLGLVVQGADNP
jgi:hypothetical protein